MATFELYRLMYEFEAVVLSSSSMVDVSASMSSHSSSSSLKLLVLLVFLILLEGDSRWSSLAFALSRSRLLFVLLLC
jgi:hypothetical protein